MLHGDELAWDFSRGLTISFVPDGTKVAGHESKLFAGLASQPDPATWQEALLRGFRTWADHTNVRVSVINDGGQPLGTGGAGQNDPRFGDVRVAAVPMTDEVHAISVPHTKLISGTWAGDVLFNSEMLQELTVDELYSVALHEAGHVFGLPHSDDPASPMFAHGIHTSLQPTEEDIDEIQKLYGVRGERQDRIDECDDIVDKGDGANVLTRSTGFADALRFDAEGTIGSVGERDEYVVGGTVDDGDMDVLTVSVWATEREQLMPVVEIRDDRGRRVDVEVLSNHGGQFIVQARNADPREAHRLVVSSAGTDPQFQTGGYTLSATFTEAESRREFFAEATVDSQHDQQDQMLYVAQTQLFHLAIEVDDALPSQDVIAWTVVYDADGEPVTGIAAHPGETRTTDSVLLFPGEYFVRSRVDRDGDLPITPLEIKIEGFGFSIPIGPPKVDPTNMPIYHCTALPDMFCYPGAPPTPKPVHWPVPPPLQVPPIAFPKVGVLTPIGTPGLWYWQPSMFKPMTGAASAPGNSNTNPNGGAGAEAGGDVLSWNNSANPADTNGDGVVVPLDALIVINFLNERGAGPLGVRQASDARVDANNDGFGTPLDVLAIINVFNA